MVSGRLVYSRGGTDRDSPLFGADRTQASVLDDSYHIHIEELQMITVYDRGEAIRFDIEVRRIVSDTQSALYDPISITITIYHGSTTDVAAVAMTKDSTGKYYYVWQTQTTSAMAQYGVIVTTGDGSYNCVRHNPVAFKLQ
jgi:myo-inositol-hexaphosphate 3-phosphohydrolase